MPHGSLDGKKKNSNSAHVTPSSPGSSSNVLCDTLNHISAIIWRSPRYQRPFTGAEDDRFEKHVPDLDSAGSANSCRDELELEYTRLMSAELQQALGAYDYPDQNTFTGSRRQHLRPFVIVVHEADDILWSRSRGRLENVAVLPAPLTAVALASALERVRVSPAFGDKIEEHTFSPQRPIQETSRNNIGMPRSTYDTV